MNETPLNIAVIGSGAAGLCAAHLLQRKHRVKLIEKSERLGGHTNTVVIPDGPDAGTPVDTGFIVMNHRNYPLLTRLFEQLGVDLLDSNMSFGYHDQPSGLQYCGSGIDGLFAQRTNLLRPTFIRMVREVMRFFKTAQQDLSAQNLTDETLGDYLARHGFSRAFIDHHLIPMGSAIWSTPCEQMMDFPAHSFLQFFNNHGLLTVNDRPQWKTVVNGSSEYIRKMQKQWQNVEIRTGSSIHEVSRDDKSVRVLYANRPPEQFDHIVIATHADQALGLLGDPSPGEQRLLGCWKYTRSRTLLHTDESVMPPLKKVWSSWNFTRLGGSRTSLTYHMNRLQRLQTSRQYFVSLNLLQDPDGIIMEIDYEHPMFTREALTFRPKLQELNGENRTWFAGSYFGNGFHEDAVRSGLEVARAFGIEL